MSEFWEIITDPAHLAAEFLWEATFLVVGHLILRRTLKSRDVEHGHDNNSDEGVTTNG